MIELFTSNTYVALLSLVLGVIIGWLVIPRMILVTVKDNWGKVPGDIDKSYFAILQIAGLSLFPSFLLALSLTVTVVLLTGVSNVALYIYYYLPDLFVVFVALTGLFIVGLKYDLRGTSSFVRLMAIIISCCVFPLSGLYISDFHGVFGIHEIPSWLGIMLTMLATAYIIEMVKLLDGMNGLASGTLFITLLLLLLLSIFSGDMMSMLLTGSALGVILPFWVMKMFRRKWRKVIIGNSGSYVMGFALAYAVVSAMVGDGSVYPEGSSLIALSVVLLPVLDVLRVIGSRARDGRSIITPDRNQINFKLLRTGMVSWMIFPTYLIAIAIFCAGTCLMVMYRLDSTLIVVVDVCAWICFELVMNYFIHVRGKRLHKAAWNRVYGRDAWNANVKNMQAHSEQLLFGTIELKRKKDEKSLDYISDGMNRFGVFTKRAFDIVVSIFCLVVFSPLFLICYILVKCDDGGPAIFKQERIGRYGRPFDIYKFRTMRLDAEKAGPQLSHTSGEDDPRLTKIGRFLRAHHLDELPQLWNVLRGDMSLIGHRPERKFYIDQIMEHDPRYALLYQIRPGVTSYATLYNGYTDTLEKMLRRLELDLYYLAHRSWWFDCKILFLTFTSILFGKKF